MGLTRKQKAINVILRFDISTARITNQYQNYKTQLRLRIYKICLDAFVMLNLSVKKTKD